MNIKDLFKILVEKQASDLHLSVGLPPMMRVNGKLTPMNEQVLSDSEIITMLKDIIPPERAKINPQTELDLSIEVLNLARFRANIYHDRKGICAALRLVPNQIKSLSELGLPEVVEKIYAMSRGLVLITGVTGSGKSTTLASIVDKINSQRAEHIITIEDPIEFVHEHKKSIVNQREIGAETVSFADALRAALREDPNVILVGEMRDLDTISMAVTAAETGHLVLATLHSSNAPDTINRIIDVFPPHQQDQIRIQLAESLAMVVSQTLLPAIDGSTRFVACEIMTVNTAIRNLIREKQTHQIRSAISVSNKDGMQTMDQSLKQLVSEGKVSRDIALEWMLEKNMI